MRPKTWNTLTKIEKVIWLSGFTAGIKQMSEDPYDRVRFIDFIQDVEKELGI